MFRRPGRGRLLLLVFLACAVVLITLDFRQGEGGPLETARDVAATVVAPIQRGFTTVFRPIGNFFSSLGDLGELQDENDALREQLEGLEQKEARYDAVIGEVASLKGNLALREDWSSMDTVAAQVTGRVPDNYKWAFRIDKGTSDGVALDMAVIAPKGLVGRIVEVDPHEAIVLLLIDPDAGAGARIKESRDTGFVQGRGSNQDLAMRFVPGEANVDVDDLVITSGYDDGIFPPGIIIGHVSSVDGASSGFEQDLSIEPTVDFNALDYVTVLLGSGTNLDDPNDKKDKEKDEQQKKDKKEPAKTAQVDSD